jgi:hypothetical protein
MKVGFGLFLNAAVNKIAKLTSPQNYCEYESLIYDSFSENSYLILNAHNLNFFLKIEELRWACPFKTRPFGNLIFVVPIRRRDFRHIPGGRRPP